MKRHSVFVGGCHDRLLDLHELKKISRLCDRVKLINPHYLHFYSGMEPGFWGSLAAEGHLL